jgi:hypothetical protein
MQQRRTNAMNETNFAKAPMILPWLAHKAGIDDRRAEILWHAALRHAARSHPPETSEYWQAAMERVLELVDAESQREDLASFGWRPWARDVAERWTQRMDIYDLIALAPVRAWRILGQKFHGPLMH